MIDISIIVGLLLICIALWMMCDIAVLKGDVYQQAVFFLLCHRPHSKVVDFAGRKYTLIAVPYRHRERIGTDWDHELKQLKGNGDKRNER